MPEPCHYWTQRFPVATLTLVEHEGEIVLCSFGQDIRLLRPYVKQYFPGARLVKDRGPLAAALQQLKEYFEKKRTVFDIPLSMHGTPFQLRVWKQLLKVKFGDTASYLDLARALGNRNLVRAIGGAMGANPIAIIVPCHRVIGASGKLVGYGGGVDVKERLLRLEGSFLI
jgi:O-6-methylguanine DNA methyltransferase